MTVTYTHDVTDCKGFGNFWRLLFRWRGSVYKLVWMDLVAYTVIYYTLSVVYRVALSEEDKRLFEKVSLYCNYFSDLIPVSFVLGFYVSIVIKRWWDQYQTLPWPDSLALFVSTSIHGHDRQGRLMRRTILRYVNLAFVLTLTMITPRAKKRFPTLDHLLEAGLMTANEKKVFAAMVEKTPHSLYYVPLVWAGTLVARARKEGRIRDDFAVKTIVDELNTLRGRCGGLLSYDWISIPLVYTQVVSLAVYTFFLSTIMGRQFLDPRQNYPKNDIDFYFPIFTMLQFFFYMGWLKVAESLVNPFGEDDDDFEVNWLIDRNIQVSYLIVDEMHNEHPELTQDLYWDEVFPQELPYTVAAEQYKREKPPMGSTANLQVPEAEQEFLPIVEEEPEDKDEANAEGGSKVDGTPDVKRIDSARSFGSALSGRKSSFLSMLHNRVRRGDQRSSVGSPISIRKNRVRSVSQSASNASADSLSEAVMRHNTTNTSLQGSEIISFSPQFISSEVEGSGEEGGGGGGGGGGHIATLSSSPRNIRRKRIVSPILSPSPSPSPSPILLLPSQSSERDPILIKVSHLQVDDGKAKGQDRGGAAVASRLDKDHSGQIVEGGSANSNYGSIFGSQVTEVRECGQGGVEGVEGSHASLNTAVAMPDPEEPEPKEPGTARPSSVGGSQRSAPADSLKIESLLASPSGHDDKNLPQASWDRETWQV